MALKGIDISHFNSVDWSKLKTDFVICKATEGLSMTDATYATNKANARKHGIVFGSYHFSDNLDPIKEATHFLEVVRDINEGEFLCLDAETGQSPDWCLKFLQEVEKQVGFKPLLYAPVANGQDWSKVIKNGNGLWFAHYGINDGLKHDNFTTPWPFVAIIQYTSKGKITGIAGNVDLDTFPGKIEALKSYGKPPVTPPVVPIPSTPQPVVETPPVSTPSVTEPVVTTTETTEPLIVEAPPAIEPVVLQNVTINQTTMDKIKQWINKIIAFWA